MSSQDIKKPAVKEVGKLTTPQAIKAHLDILGHRGFGVTELRVFEPTVKVAYADNTDDLIRLALQMQGKAKGIYIGVQPRPLFLFERAANKWMPAKDRCCRDRDIEYITCCFWDIDVVSEKTELGFCASEKELQNSLKVAEILGCQPGLKDHSVSCCSGNGHYCLTPIVPVSVYEKSMAVQFKNFCRRLASKPTDRVNGVKLDPVFNLSRIMRLMGTNNYKRNAVENRPHRRACFIRQPVVNRSIEVHYMITNTPVQQRKAGDKLFSEQISCDLQKLEQCEFIRFCRNNPEKVSEPQWYALITNLARLKGGPELIHEISALDKRRYDYWNTEKLINRVIKSGYKPVNCSNLVSQVLNSKGRANFKCKKINQCRVKAPMYLATLRTVYKR